MVEQLDPHLGPKKPSSLAPRGLNEQKDTEAATLRGFYGLEVGKDWVLFGLNIYRINEPQQNKPFLKIRFRIKS